MPLVHLNVLGMKIDVSGLSDSEAEFVSRHWAHCVIPQHSEPVETVERNQASWERAYEALTQRITNLAITLNVGKYIMFHATGLQLPGTPQVFAFVAPSGTGKSTLASVLGKKMGYVSDEVVAVDSDLTVLPMQKPVSLIGRSLGARKGHIGPEQLEIVTKLTRVPKLTSIFVLDRVPGANQVEITRMALDDALLALVPQLSGLGQMDAGLEKLCNLIERVKGVYKLTYSEATDIDISLLKDHVASLKYSPEIAWIHVPRTVNNKESLGFEFKRSDFLDVVLINERISILNVGQIKQLGELASEVWLNLSTVSSREELLAILERKFGEHEESRQILEQTLHGLEENNLITKIRGTLNDLD